MRRFPQSILSNLKYYVYLYVDPRDDTVFYVGKGTNNRAFAHLRSKSEQQKTKRIKQIQVAGLQPKIEILVHGLRDEATAMRIEASVIDLIGIENLTNLQKGYGSREYGRMSTDQIAATYAAVKVDISEPAILININKSYRYGITPGELYDATRSAWRIGKRRLGAKYAFAVYQGVVQEVYEILEWYAADATFNCRTIGQANPSARRDRLEFIGRIASPNLRAKYVLNNVAHLMGPRYPLTYVNCQ